MIRPCTIRDFAAIFEIINDAASAYKGIIPADRWHHPYMSESELTNQLNAGVKFWGYDLDNHLVAVMGLQDKNEVMLIRHAYVKTNLRNQGIGGKLLTFLINQTSVPVLIGTWADASWAITFYQKHHFRLVSHDEKEYLLGKYWSIPARQIESSVVLVSPDWRNISDNRD